MQCMRDGDLRQAPHTLALAAVELFLVFPDAFGLRVQPVVNASGRRISAVMTLDERVLLARRSLGAALFHRVPHERGRRGGPHLRFLQVSLLFGLKVPPCLLPG